MSETITVHAEPINVDTPFGKALCIAWYDYGFWTETQWKCVVQEGGHIVFVPHQDIRITHQYSARVKSSKPPAAPSYMAKVLKNEPSVEAMAITSVDKFSDADHGERWGEAEFRQQRGEPMHLPEDDGA